MTATMRWATLALAATTLASGIACRRHQLPTTTITVGDTRMLVEVADNGETRARGMMNRDRLPADEGMLFVYPDEKPRSYWMKNVRIPLSIAFARQDGTIVTIADMAPMTTRSTPSDGPAMYALEVNKGWFAEHGVSVGDKLGKLPGPAER